MILLTKKTDYNVTIDLAKNLNGVYDKPVTFHCYWNGNLTEKQLISIRSCYFFNVKNKPNNKIIFWVENVYDNEYSEEIKKYCEIKQFSLSEVSKETFLENKNLNQKNGAISYYSDIVRYFILYKHGGCWFDVDCFFLRCLDPIFLNYENDVCVYQWECQGYPNGAIYICLKPQSEKLKNIIEFIINRNQGWGFQEASLDYGCDIPLTVLPCSWFDGYWIVNPHSEIEGKFDNLFLTTDKKYNFDNFLTGAFVLHWHNKWEKIIEPNSIIDQLDQTLKGFLSHG